YMVKRFQVEPSRDAVGFITEHPESKLTLHSIVAEPELHIAYDKRSTSRADEDVDLAGFIGVKGVKALGNRLTPHKVKELTLNTPVFVPLTPEAEEVQGMLITDDEIGNLEAPEEEGLEESPMKQMKRAKSTSADVISPDDPLIGGYKPGKQIELGLDE
ncbi:MAG TPA: hypothetical protein PKY96_09130, partial [Flavobacteriales bacterium]|nr:hypothetical protein [Flavobacteriales bacterium]